MKPFIKGHILRVLNQYQQEIEYKSCYSVYKTIPFELYIKKYLKINRENLSASDNISIISTSFKLLRFKEFLDHAFKCNDWSDRLESSGQLYEISWQSPEIQDLPL